MGIGNDELRVRCPECQILMIVGVIHVEGTRRQRTVEGNCQKCNRRISFSYFPCVKCTKEIVTGTVKGDDNDSHQVSPVRPVREHF